MPCSISWLRSTRRESAIEHARERFQELAIGRCAVRRLRQHGRKPATQQRVTGRLGSKLNRQWNEPRGLSCARAGTSDRGILFEQREERGTLGGKMAIDGALGESGGQRHLIQRRDLEAALGEQLEPSRYEEGPGFGLATLVNDSHGYLGYLQGPYAQDGRVHKGARIDTSRYRRYHLVP